MKKRFNKLIALSGVRGKLQRNKFKSNGYFYYSGQRATFTEALQYIQNTGMALDIGAGFGNEVKVLLKRGFKVVATDPNPEAATYLKQLAKRKKRLTSYQQSLPKMPNGKFDFVVCEMVLHFLNKQDAHESIRKMQDATVLGGLNVISSYIEQPEIHQAPGIEPDYFHFLLDKDELKNLYKGWEILYYEEKSNVMNIKSARIVARKLF